MKTQQVTQTTENIKLPESNQKQKTFLRNQTFVFIICYIAYASVSTNRICWSQAKTQIQIKNLGYVDSTFLFCYSLAMKVLGSYGDKVNLKYFIGLSMILTSLSSALIGILALFDIKELWTTALLMGINGITSSTLWPGFMAVMGNWFCDQNKGIVMGIYITCYNVGIIFGYQVIGNLVFQWAPILGWQYCLIFAGIYLCLNGLILIIFLKPYNNLTIQSQQKTSVNSTQYMKKQSIMIPMSSINNNQKIDLIEIAQKTKTKLNKVTPISVNSQPETKSSLEESPTSHENQEYNNNNQQQQINHLKLNLQKLKSDEQFDSPLNICQNFKEKNIFNSDNICISSDDKIAPTKEIQIKEKAQNDIESQNQKDLQLKEQESEKIQETEQTIQKEQNMTVKNEQKNQQIQVQCQQLNQQTIKLNYFTAWLIPGVALYALAYASMKSTYYGFFFWLPTYLKDKQVDFINIASMFEYGMLISGVIFGKVADKTKKMTQILLISILISCFLILSVKLFLNSTETPYYFVIFGIGFFFGGPYLMISTVITMELGNQKSLKQNKQAIATISSLIESSGSFCAAIIQIICQLIGDNLFYLFTILTFSTAIVFFYIIIKGKNKEG